MAEEIKDAPQPSRTSIWAAAARAFGARDPDETVRNPDWLVRRLLGPEELALLRDHPLAAALDQAYEEAAKDIEVIGSARTLIPRTRFIDERLEEAIRGGATAVVILGAGFDTRAYRFADLLKDARVFEVDHPATQEIKMRRVRAAIGEPPTNLKYVALDFRHQTLDALMDAGYRAGDKSFFIWEGVTMYLPAEAVRNTLRWIATHSAPGSAVVFDYTYEGLIRMFGAIDLEKVPEPARAALERWKRMTAGEPWIFGLPDKGEQEFLSGLGLELRKVLGLNSAEAVEKYLTRVDGSIVGALGPSEQQGYLLLEATVPAY